jgi:predicted TIM-barrel fold metal-dependent hydrolase
MIKYYDTHIHIPSPDEEGLIKFLDYVKMNPLMLGGLLIMNDQKDVDFIAKNVDKIPSNFIIVPFYNYEDKKYPDAVTSSGWLKIHPVINRISKDDIPELIRFVKEKRPSVRGIIVHCFPWGAEMDYNFSLPLVLELNRNFPTLDILIAHGGGYESWQFRAHTGGIRNFIYDFSVTLKYYGGSDLVRPFQRYLIYSSDRVLFGSDYPIAMGYEQLEESLRLASEVGISEDQLESIYINNFLRIWGHLLK